MRKDAKLFVAGHRGLVGSSIVRTRQELDLANQGAVFAFLRKERPDAVVVAAAKVGGIGANSAFPADFIENVASR